MLNRRTFFGGLTSLLAGLPWAGKSIAAKHNGTYWSRVPGWFGRGLCKDKNQQVVTVSDDNGNFATLPLECAVKVTDRTGLYETIRWIPVEERLPECDTRRRQFDWKNRIKRQPPVEINADGPAIWHSRRVLVKVCGPGYAGHSALANLSKFKMSEHDEQTDDKPAWCYVMDDGTGYAVGTVTHWAELPKGPQA